MSDTTKKIINNHTRDDHVGLSIESIPRQYCYHFSDTLLVLCPPDPNWGGNMYTPIIEYLFWSFDQHKLDCVRFSFARYQIFNNDSSYEKYIIQTSVCLDEILQEFAGNQMKIWLVGFSFGALCALNIFLRRPNIAGFILLSPPVLNYDFVSWLTTNIGRGLLIYGTKDELLPQNVAQEFFLCLKKHNLDVTLQSIPGANHCFQNKEAIVSNIILSFIQK